MIPAMARIVASGRKAGCKDIGIETYKRSMCML